MPKHGDLKVWMIPQVPMKAFEVPVQTLIEAKLVLDTLADYDLFQLEHHVKPDYSSVGGLIVYDEPKPDGTPGDWVDWHDEYGEDMNYYTLSDLRQAAINGTLPRWEGDAS